MTQREERLEKSHPYGRQSNSDIPTHVAEVFWSRVIESDPYKCWEWPRVKDDGYGRFECKRDGILYRTSAHRASWIIVHGVIKPGITVDHLCRNRPCVNPLHLRLLPNIDNARDNQNLRKTHCNSGHEFTSDNTYYVKGRFGVPFRQCIACRRIKYKRWYDRHKKR